jgi:hypothetical protein
MELLNVRFEDGVPDRSEAGCRVCVRVCSRLKTIESLIVDYVVYQQNGSL